ncbi:MAG: STAS domain-containing protein [Planctomycetota bacterium]|jgi:rsbT antagonist protein RsbS
MSSEAVSKIPLQLAQECVVASIQVDLDDQVLRVFRDELLEFVRTSGARGVILDLSGVQVMDAVEFGALRDTMRMARLMGALTVVSGLQPGVVSALIDLGADTDGVEATATLDDAFHRMWQLRRGEDPTELEADGGAGTEEPSLEEGASHDGETGLGDGH